MITTLKIKTTELIYWRVRRPLNRLRYKMLRRVPAGFLYWGLIEAASRAEPNANPAERTVGEVLEYLKPHDAKQKEVSK